jgi:[protein-PII] uridylyltransferase
MSVVLFSGEVRERYESGLAALRREFDYSGNGVAVVSGRTALVDDVVLTCYEQLVEKEIVPPNCVSIVALGGYGRGSLLPHSDVDLLFLFRDAKHEGAYKDSLSRIYLDLWDLKIRASATARTVVECGKLDPENPEFTVSLLDSRFLTGDRELFDEVRNKVLPNLMRRSGTALMNLVCESARTRHAKYANTIYHLEPQVKEGPGGLRDYNLANWLALAKSFRASGLWPAPESLFQFPLRAELNSAFDFLVSVRCFLHYRHGRDDNQLSWEAQDAAAEKGIGAPSVSIQPGQWMREYFRNARTIRGASLQLMDDAMRSPPSLLDKLRAIPRKARTGAKADVPLPGILQLQSPPSLKTALALFQRMASEPLQLSVDAQRFLRASASQSANASPEVLWPELSPILVGRFAGSGLRAMRDSGYLDVLIPELKLIDALVIRDYFHRYTVDEHSILTIDTLHGLRSSESEWAQRFAEILDELDKPEVLYLALLLHDVGKGVEGDDHVIGSLNIAKQVLARLNLDSQDQDTVLFLIRSHLEMSASMRRDIFDAKVIAALAAKVETPEQLKMLTLLTYADISSVNPEAMTEWKAETLWHLYASTANFLNRHVDDAIVHATLGSDSSSKFHSFPAELAKQLEPFLEGLPQRYLKIYSSEQIVQHFKLFSRLQHDDVELSLLPHRDLYELTIISGDKPGLFATIAGALSASGMEIVKANAFSNSSGIAVDSFYFEDRFRTLDLNASEHEQLKEKIRRILRGERSLDDLISSRTGFLRPTTPKVQIETKVLLENESSTHTTLLEVVAQDRPGLLYQIAKSLAQLGCNIEIALIDTEGEMALDVFYLTADGRKLSAEMRDRLHDELQKKLNAG